MKLAILDLVDSADSVGAIFEAGRLDPRDHCGCDRLRL